MKLSSSFTVVTKTSSLQLPTLAGTLSIKSMLQSAPKHVIFILKIQKLDPLPHPPPWRLRRLELRAFGAHSRTPPTRKSGYGPVESEDTRRNWTETDQDWTQGNSISAREWSTVGIVFLQKSWTQSPLTISRTHTTAWFINIWTTKADHGSLPVHQPTSTSTSMCGCRYFAGACLFVFFSLLSQQNLVSTMVLQPSEMQILNLADM